MIHSVLYILLIISLVNGVPNSYLDSLSSFGGWISSVSSTENQTEDAKKDENIPIRRVVDVAENNVEVVNPDEPILIDDFLEEFKKDAPNTDENERKEIVGVLHELRNAVYDDSLRKVKVLYKGFWHFVDLGLARTSQRQRSAEKTEGVLQSLLDLFKAINKWFWRCFGYEMDDDKDNDSDDEDDDKKKGDKEKKEGDKDKDKPKDKEKIKVEDKDGKIKDKKTGGETGDSLQDKDSGDSSNKGEKSDVVLKPLDPKDPKTHTSSNGKLTFDTKWNENGGQSVQNAMKSLSELTSLLGDKLLTREEVDKELKEAQDKKELTNRFLVRVENAKKLMKTEKDEREWTEAAALKRLEEMDKDFDKTTDKAPLVKDIKSLSMQPLYYIETYDKIMDMIDRLKDSGVPEKDLRLPRDSLFEEKLFSLEHSIQQTPRKQYQAERHKKHIEVAKKEREQHKDTREWTEADALTRIADIDKNFEASTDKPAMLKDLASMSMQPSYTIDTYNKLYALMDKLKKKKLATEEELETAENALKRKSRYVYLDGILKKADMQEHEKYKLQTDKAKEKREKHKDTREFTEEQALKNIKDMDDNFESKDKSEMTKDVTNLSMQPLYHVETYDKLSNLIGKLKKKGVADDALKPAEESLEEEKEFSTKHDLRQKPQGSMEEKLHNMRTKYIKTEPLDATQKKDLFKELEIIRNQDKFTQNEATDAFLLIKALMGDSSVIEPSKVADLYSLVTKKQKDPANVTETKVHKESTISRIPTSADLQSMHVSGLNPADFKLGKVSSNGEVSAA